MRLSRATVLPLVLVLVVVGAATAVLALGNSSSSTKLPGGVKKGAPAGGFDGAVLSPIKQAPPIALRNYLGQPVTLAQYRGKLMTIYPSNFKPADIVHDVPRLAAA